jgi:hypothetical protein
MIFKKKDDYKYNKRNKRGFYDEKSSWHNLNED